MTSRAALVVAALLVCGWARVSRADWQTYDFADGSPNYFSKVLTGSAGTLWFGAQRGIVRYDGVHWTTTPPLVASNLISYTGAVLDRDGLPWFAETPYAGSSTLRRFDGVQWVTVPLPPDAITVPWALVSGIARDGPGNMWIGTPAGAFRLRDTTWTRYTPESTNGFLPGLNVVGITADSSGNIWCITDAGVGVFDGQNWRVKPPLWGDCEFAFTDRNGIVRVGGGSTGWEQIAHWEDARGWVIQGPAEGVSVGDVSSMGVASSGDLWVGGSQGLVRFDGRRWIRYGTGVALPDPRITAIEGDPQGNVWIGTVTGIVRFDGSESRPFTSELGLRTDSNLADIAVDGAGDVWVTEGWGMARYDGTSWKPEPVGFQPTRLYVDRTGTMWAWALRQVPFGPILARRDPSGWVYEDLFSCPAGGCSYMTDAKFAEDSTGNLWIATTGWGVARIGPAGTRLFTAADGPASDNVLRIHVDRHGVLWLGTDAGLTRFDGTTWTTYTHSNTNGGLRADHVFGLFEDVQGRLWLNTIDGACSFDGSTWGRPAAPFENAYVVLTDREGGTWMLKPDAFARWDGSDYRLFGPAETAVNLFLVFAQETRDGLLWFGTGQGVNRFSSGSWSVLTTRDGLAESYAQKLVEDHSGGVWFLGLHGVTHHTPDLVPPRAAFRSRPDPIVVSPRQAALFASRFDEAGVSFSWRFDGGAWSAWSSDPDWDSGILADGVHRLELVARDRAGNVEAAPAICEFEVDATPPAPILDAPRSRDILRDSVMIVGTASDPRFRDYLVQLRPAGTPDWGVATTTVVLRGTTPVTSGALGVLDTRSLADGAYDLRIVESDTLGLSGSATIAVIVDNEFPPATSSSPARIGAEVGGDVYTTDGTIHLYIPPRGFDRDAVVHIDEVPAGSVPASLPSGATKVRDGFEIGWDGTLLKPARLEFSTSGVEATGSLSLYRSVDGTQWGRLGGTPDRDGASLTLTIDSAGRYALFAETVAPSGEGRLSGLTFTPRVFSPHGRFADSQVGISFTLGRPAPVTVAVYSRSGRLIREVARSQPLGAGQNLVRWDGRDRDGAIVNDGIYVVTVEALDQIERSTLAVVK